MELCLEGAVVKLGCFDQGRLARIGRYGANRFGEFVIFYSNRGGVLQSFAFLLPKVIAV